MIKSKVLLAMLSILISSLMIVGAVVWYGSRTPQLGGAFTLNHLGQDWVLLDQTKKLNLIYVGYVKCPDVCPMTLTYAAQSFRQLSQEELENTQLLFISVDVAHDTPESVAQYAEQFAPQFIGLTGSEESIANAVQKIGASFMLEPSPGSRLGYSIAHSDRLFFLNKKGLVIDTIPNPRSAELITQKIKENL